MKKESSNRIYNLDICRTLAILSISLNHALNSFTSIGNSDKFFSVNYFEQLFLLIAYFFSIIGVPLFLTLTGALILNKKFENFENIKKFYKHNLLDLVISVMIWNIIYYFIGLWVWNMSFSLRDLLLTTFFMRWSALGNMWYMPMIIGMYVFLPYISILVKKYDFKELLVPIIFTVVTCFLLPNIKGIAFMLGKYNWDVTTILNLSFCGSVYGIYVVMGYYIYKKELLRKIPTKTIKLSFALSFLLTVLYQAFALFYGGSYSVTYDFLIFLIASLLAFELILRLKPKKQRKFFEYISRISLGIYFIHRPIMHAFVKLIKIDFPLILGVFAYYIAAIGLSVLIIWLLSKTNKYIKKYLLCAK